MSSRTDVLLFHRPTGQYVPAVLIDGVSKQEIEVAERAWRPALSAALAEMEARNVPKEQRPTHGHWDWRKKHTAIANLLVYQILGVECQGQLQGLMLIQTAGIFSRVPAQGHKGLVYVLFLETAPWNSALVVPEPHYRHVGSILIAAAIEVSDSLGFKGRLGLHALPQSESWYAKRCGMTNLGPDPAKQGLRYFEMTEEQANEFRTPGSQ